MNNEYLRLNNADSQQDLSVNKYSAKLNAKNKANRQRQSSALGLIIDEVYSVQEKTELIQQESVKKPKILDAVFFSFAYLISLILLAFIVKTTKNLVLLYVLAMGSSFYIPLSFIYFFYRLDVRGKLKFSSIAYCVLIGFAIYLAIDFVFEKFVLPSFCC